MIQNHSNRSGDWFAPDPPIDCSIVTSIGVFCVALFVVSVWSNSTVIWILIKNRNHLFNTVNILTVILSGINLIGTIIELPMVGTAAFQCKFVFGKYGCYFEGFAM
jgi:hypothetical protein